jgi:hypothetical protein
MAVAVTITDRDVEGSNFVKWATLAFSGTYTTNGEAPTNGFLRDLELPSSGKIVRANIDGGGGAAVGVVAEYDRTNHKVKLYRVDQIDDFMEELPNATSLTGITLHGEFKGR